MLVGDIQLLTLAAPLQLIKQKQTTDSMLFTPHGLSTKHDYFEKQKKKMYQHIWIH